MRQKNRETAASQTSDQIVASDRAAKCSAQSSQQLVCGPAKHLGIGWVVEGGVAVLGLVQPGHVDDHYSQGQAIAVGPADLVAQSPRKVLGIRGSREAVAEGGVNGVVAAVGKLSVAVANPNQHLHPSEELPQVDRLVDVVVGAAVQPSDSAAGVGAGGHHQHRRQLALRRGLEPAAHLEAIEARHHDVENHHVEWAVIVKAGEGLVTVHRPHGLDSLGLQEVAENLLCVLVVVDDKDPSGSWIVGLAHCHHSFRRWRLAGDISPRPCHRSPHVLLPRQQNIAHCSRNRGQCRWRPSPSTSASSRGSTLTASGSGMPMPNSWSARQHVRRAATVS